MNNRAAALHLSGALVEAESLAKRALAEADSRDLIQFKALLSLTLCEILIDSSRHAIAEEYISEGLAYGVGSNDVWLTINARLALAYMQLREQRLLQVRQTLTLIQETIVSASAHQRIQFAVCRSLLACRDGRYDIALQLMESTLPTLQRQGVMVDLARCQLVYAYTLFLLDGLEAALPSLRACIQTRNRVLCHVSTLRLSDHMSDLWAACADSSVGVEIGSQIRLPDPRPSMASLSRRRHASNQVESDPSPESLDSRERLVVIGLSQGLDRDVLAQRLARSRSTIDKTISRIYDVTGFRSCHQIVAWAYRTGFYRHSAGRADDVNWE
jgi:DNA-binding CsgD family transcriptional regulator